MHACMRAVTVQVPDDQPPQRPLPPPQTDSHAHSPQPAHHQVVKGQDVMISVYNIHHSPAVWDNPEAFRPERFPLDAPVPSEQNTDYR